MCRKERALRISSNRFDSFLAKQTFHHTVKYKVVGDEMNMQRRMSVCIVIVQGTYFSLAEISASCALMSAICPSNATILASRVAYLKWNQ